MCIRDSDAVVGDDEDDELGGDEDDAIDAAAAVAAAVDVGESTKPSSFSLSFDSNGKGDSDMAVIADTGDGSNLLLDPPPQSDIEGVIAGEGYEAALSIIPGDDDNNNNNNNNNNNSNNKKK